MSAAAECGSLDFAGYDELLFLEEPIPASQVKVRFDRKRFDVKRSPLFDAKVRDTWEKRLAGNPHLFNALKFRLGTIEQHQHDNARVVELGLGICDYATFLGTNKHPDAVFIQALKDEGLKTFNDPGALFGSPFGNTALVITSDNCVPLQRRSFRTAEFAGWWDSPGGHPEPSRVGITAEQPTVPEVESKIVSELFLAMQDEVHGELNVPNEFIGEPRFIGILAHKASHGRPGALFEEIAKYYQAGGGETDESTCLVFVSVDVVVAQHGPLKSVIMGTLKESQTAHAKPPVTFEDINDHLVPSGSFALEALRRWETRKRATPTQ